MLILTAAPARALDRQSAAVQEVLSGDTVRLAGGKILRYAGLQAPSVNSKLPLVRRYAEDSQAFNKTLAEGKRVTIEWDSQIRDNRGILIGYVFLDDGRLVNEEILKAGQARAFVEPPNLRYSAVFRRADLTARRQKLGLWKEEPENPYIRSEYIGEKNTKIFYFPTSPELERIPQAQLVTFRSRVEAKAAGYRACSTCKEASEDSRFE